MTLEEYRELQIGDKVQIEKLCSYDCYACTRLLREQDKNDGYLIIDRIREGYCYTRKGTQLNYKNVELYEENRPWSYERDY
jgi:hypothetical protein